MSRQPSLEAGITRRIIILLLCGLGIIPAAGASTVIFATHPQQVAGREINVKATFDFDFTARTVTIYLLNLEANPTDISQALGSLRFDLVNAGATPTLAYLRSSIGTFDINNQGGLVSDTQKNRWKVNNTGFDGGNQVAFCVVCAQGGTGKEMVLGGPSGTDGNATYSNAIIAQDTTLTDGNSNPFIIGSGLAYAKGPLHTLNTSPDWVFKLPNVTPTVMVSNVIFGFGEGAAYGATSFTMANYTEYDVPEPESNVMVVTGLGMLAIAFAVRNYFRFHS